MIEIEMMSANKLAYWPSQLKMLSQLMNSTKFMNYVQNMKPSSCWVGFVSMIRTISKLAVIIGFVNDRK
jgi:hypothetical protein